MATIREGGLNVEMVNWRGVLGASGLSNDDRARLTALVSQAAHSPEWQKVLLEREWSDLYLDGAAFDDYLAAERTRVGRVVARLRGPGRGAPIVAGQRLVPIAVLGGAAVVFAALVVTQARNRRRFPAQSSPVRNRGAVIAVALGLVMFLVLLQPLGFIAAASGLFVMTANAFATLRSRRQQLWTIAVAAVFIWLVHLAFTDGLNLPLPHGTWW